MAKAYDEYGIAKGVEVRGWDDMRLVQKCRKLVKKARKALYLEGNSNRHDIYHTKALAHGMRRNQSLHRALVAMEGVIKEENTLYVVAGAAHIKRNTELLEILHNYSSIVIEAQTDKELREKTGLQGFP